LGSPIHCGGRGYATEGARAALEYAFTVWYKDRIISLIHPANHASIRVAERLGESLQGRTNALGEERLIYGIDRESYDSRPALQIPPAQTGASAILTTW